MHCTIVIVVKGGVLNVEGLKLVILDHPTIANPIDALEFNYGMSQILAIQLNLLQFTKWMYIMHTCTTCTDMHSLYPVIQIT